MLQMQDYFSGLAFEACRKCFFDGLGPLLRRSGSFHIEAARFEAARFEAARFHFPPQRQNAGVRAGQKGRFIKPFRPRSLAPVSARRSDGR